METTRRAAAPPARPPCQAWPTAAFINAASLLTFDARFISPLLPYAQIFGTAPGEMVRIRGACLCRFDPLWRNTIPPAPCPQPGRHLRVFRPDGRAAHFGAGRGNLGRSAGHHRRPIFQRDHSFKADQRALLRGNPDVPAARGGGVKIVGLDPALLHRPINTTTK